MNQRKGKRERVKYIVPKRIVISSAAMKKAKKKLKETPKLMSYKEEGAPIMQEQTYGGRQQMSPLVTWQKYPNIENK